MSQEIEQPEVSKAIWMYHKELGAVLFESADEVKSLDSEEWFDHPSCGAASELVKKFKPSKPLEKMTKIELLHACISVGIDKEKAAGLTKDELINLLK